MIVASKKHCLNFLYLFYYKLKKNTTTKVDLQQDSLSSKKSALEKRHQNNLLKIDDAVKEVGQALAKVDLELVVNSPNYWTIKLTDCHVYCC